MKKLFLFIALCFLTMHASSQEIYKAVVQMKADVENLANDTTKNIETRKIACFKYDALYYLIDKAGHAEHFSEYELGTQANAMIEFVNLYVNRLTSEKKKKDKDVVLAIYKNASVSNPLFHDSEKDITYGYVDNDNYLTQFSLDTDWVNALAAVKK